MQKTQHQCTTIIVYLSCQTRPECPCVLPDLESGSASVSHSDKSSFSKISTHSVRSLYWRPLETPPFFFAFRKPHICTATCIHGHPRHRHPVAAAKCRHPTAPACDSVRTVSFDGTHPNHSMKLRSFLVPVMHSSS